MFTRHPVGIIYLIILLVLSFPCRSFGQDSTTKVLPNGTDGLTLELRSDELDKNKYKDLAPNEFDGRFSTVRLGFGFIYDFTTYAQNEVFKKQMDSAGLSLGPTSKTRDFRVLISGTLKTKRPLSWKLAYMYDGNTKSWLFRESGLTIGIPELSGNIFIGRTKEGFSMVKVMNGHSPWTNERQMALDPIPILADGIKYFGYFPKSGIFLNLGAYTDWLSKGQSFSTYEWQYVGRVGWMKYLNKQKNELLHIGANLRYAKPLDGKMTIKSRPESNPTPQLINTGSFETNRSSHFGYEIYYNNGGLLIGSEGMVHNFYSEKSQDHNFYGGDFVITYLFNRGRRPYNTTGSIFGFVPVRNSLFKGGWGQWEAVLHYSTFNLNNGDIHGGQFWRFTPMVNWYVSKVIRLEFIYGYGTLDRFNQKGNVSFYEARIQFTGM